jgi:hypothetical protein
MEMDDILVRIRSSNERGFEQLAPQAITRATLDRLESQETVSLDDIIGTMQSWLDRVPEKNNPMRGTITEGIRYLRDLQERQRSS